MTTLDDEILKGVNAPTEGFFNEFLIEGTTEAIENKLRQAGWDGRTPRASIIIHFESKEILHVQLVISGYKDIGHTMATTLWGSEQHEGAHVKFGHLDLAIPIFINTVTSRWLNQRLSWNLNTRNPETGHYNTIPKTDKQAIEDRGATELNIKVHVHLERGPKLMGRVGVAPTNKVEHIVGNERDVFPLIQLGDQFNIEFFPQESQNTGLGLGILPFFSHSGEEGDGRGNIPDIGTIKSSLSEFFNNTHQVKMKKNYTKWSLEVSKGNWEEIDPKYWWPSFSSGQKRGDEPGKTQYNRRYPMSH